jgi:hypothetical protein
VIIQKACYLNPVEPALFNIRAPSGMETKLDVTFYEQDGSVYNQDLAAQLQLTARTQEQTFTYLMPATDVVNGKARATIPADTLNDANGYRLRILGTLRGEPTLLAMGALYPLSGAGPGAIPEDVIDAIDLTLDRGDVVSLDVHLWQDAGKTVPYDLTSMTVTASIYAGRGGVELVPFTVAIVDGNTVTLTLTVDEVNALPDSCWWNLNVSGASGLTTLAEGTVTVTGTP